MNITELLGKTLRDVKVDYVKAEIIFICDDLSKYKMFPSHDLSIQYFSIY